MSSDDSANTPTNETDDPVDSSGPLGRREAVREKAQQVKVRQSRVRMLRVSSLIIGAVAIIAVLAVGVTLAITSATTKPDLQPASASDGGFVVAPAAGAATADATPTEAPPAQPAPSTAGSPTKVEIRVYVDYLSPGAKEFQEANSPQLDTWLEQGAASLTYYPVAMLTSKSNGTKYSLRAASAAACVASHDNDSFRAYNDSLLKNQPGPDGFSDEKLAELAAKAGASSPAVQDCILNEDFATWAKTTTDRALEGLPDTKGLALTAVPTVLVNGSLYVGNLDDPKEFAQFVLTLASDAYYGTPSPTPTASAPAAG